MNLTVEASQGKTDSSGPAPGVIGGSTLSRNDGGLSAEPKIPLQNPLGSFLDSNVTKREPSPLGDRRFREPVIGTALPDRRDDLSALRRHDQHDDSSRGAKDQSQDGRFNPEVAAC